MSTTPHSLSNDPIQSAAGRFAEPLASTDFQPLTWFQRLTRRQVIRRLQGIASGRIAFHDPWCDRQFGAPVARPVQTDRSRHRRRDGVNGSVPPVRWVIHDPRFYSLLGSRGSLGVAESYLRGHWRSDDLTGLLAVLYRNLGRWSRASTSGFAIPRWLRRVSKRFQRSTRQLSKRQIAAHYDLSNEFFELFLDPTLMYSAGYFERADDSMERASIAKLEMICRKLDLKHTDRVLEIGTGWGGFGLHAVGQHGIRLTTTTISESQFSKSRERFADAGLTDRIELLKMDYRDLEGQFDKIVSIEMVEAVGERSLGAYFRQCGRLLRPGGRLVLQAIVMPEQRYRAYRLGTDFIQTYIFPGGFLPSVTALQEAVGRETDLRLSEVEDFSPHYARTLDAWRQAFLARLDQVRDLGFDERFIRMWEYYLCYCEAAFREQAVRVVQIVWEKPQDRATIG